MSRVLLNSVWQHELVLPYLLGDLKTKIEKITKVKKILLYGSRARTPMENWDQLAGKDWDIIVVGQFPIINTGVWTNALNYHIDLKVVTTETMEKIFQYNKAVIELWPKDGLSKVV